MHFDAKRLFILEKYFIWFIYHRLFSHFNGVNKFFRWMIIQLQFCVTLFSKIKKNFFSTSRVTCYRINVVQILPLISGHYITSDGFWFILPEATYLCQEITLVWRFNFCRTMHDNISKNRYNTIPGKSRHQFYPHFVKEVTQYVHFTAVAIFSLIFTCNIIVCRMECL